MNELENLPSEIIEKVISHVNHPKDVLCLLLVNKKINKITYLSINQLGQLSNHYDIFNKKGIKLSSVKNFTRIKKIKYLIECDSLDEFYEVGSLVNVDEIYIRITDDNTYIDFDLIISWLNRYKHILHRYENKILFKFKSSDVTMNDQYVLINKGYLFIDCEYMIKYSDIYHLMKLINNIIPLRGISSINIENVNFRDIKKEFPSLNTIIISSQDGFNVNDTISMLNLPFINKIKYLFRNSFVDITLACNSSMSSITEIKDRTIGLAIPFNIYDIDTVMSKMPYLYKIGIVMPSDTYCRFFQYNYNSMDIIEKINSMENKYPNIKRILIYTSIDLNLNVFSFDKKKIKIIKLSEFHYFNDNKMRT